MRLPDVEDQTARAARLYSPRTAADCDKSASSFKEAQQGFAGAPEPARVRQHAAAVVVEALGRDGHQTWRGAR